MNYGPFNKGHYIHIFPNFLKRMPGKFCKNTISLLPPCHAIAVSRLTSPGCGLNYMRGSLNPPHKWKLTTKRGGGSKVDLYSKNTFFSSSNPPQIKYNNNNIFWRGIVLFSLT